ncbi:MAG: hypothetical protein QNK33_07685 [Bacteroidales bacterium]|nr:hypothetical protein [Bacteroidales bacterium]
MKKIILLILTIIAYLQLSAQTEGISYQAVIIGPNSQEIPGVDSHDNILPNASVAIRFTILDANNIEEYQEVQTTNTDRYGRVNLMIGSMDPNGFSLITWDGTSKSLKVDIDFTGVGSNFVDMGRQDLNFVPYSFHRNIIARGTLVVDDVTDLNGELRVAGPTNLNSTLNVNNSNVTNLSGQLIVAGTSDLSSSLNVAGTTNLDADLNVNNNSAANLSGNLLVGGSAQFDGSTQFDDLNVSGNTSMTGQVTINTKMANLEDSSYEAYPLRVEGSMQGIAVKVNGSRSNNNNYVTFWDSTGIQGRIEGETALDLVKTPEWISETAIRGADILINTFELISTTIDAVLDLSEAITRTADVRAVVSVIPGATVPSPTRISVQWVKVIKVVADVVGWIANEAIAVTELLTFEHFSLSQVGVTYQSKGADYAEWLPKENPGDSFIPGELVGIRNGIASKKVFGADKVMVVSSNPIVVGNMPQDAEKSLYVKIAFMGQVPVRVLGEVQSGDYILPSELSSGMGKAVHPDNMETRDYIKIVGVAWDSFSTPLDGFKIVNTAVGINHNDLANIVADQQKILVDMRQEHNQLRNLVIQSNIAIESLLPGYAEKLGDAANPGLTAALNNYDLQNNKTSKAGAKGTVVPGADDIITVVISREEIESAIEVAKNQYKDMMKDANMLSDLPGVDKLRSSYTKRTQDSKSPGIEGLAVIDVANHPFWSRIDSDPDYKEEIIQYLKSSVEKTIIQKEKKGQNKFVIEFVNF